MNAAFSPLETWGIINSSKRTRCSQGHLLEGDNVYERVNKGYLEKICKTCSRAYQNHYNRTSPVYKARMERTRAERSKAGVVRNKNYRLELRKLVYNLKSQPCLDCGQEFPPWVMDFDHVRGEKVSDVSSLIDNCVAKKRLLAEVAKCDLVCANCHRLRTHERKQDKIDYGHIW